MALGSFASEACEFGSFVADSRGDTAPVEPVGTFHDSVEVEIFGLSLCDRRTGTVVDYLRGAHRSTGLAIVDTYAVTATSDVLCMHTVTTKSVYSGLADFVSREFAHEVCIVTIVSAAYCYVGFTATPNYIKVINLHETLAACRRKAEHNLAECYDFHSSDCISVELRSIINF